MEEYQRNCMSYPKNMLFPFHKKYFTSIYSFFEWIPLKKFSKILGSMFCFVLFTNHKVRIKSIHKQLFKTAFCSSLYLLLSDSIQNILITFGAENACHVSFKVQSTQIHSTSCGMFCQILRYMFIIQTAWRNVEWRNFDLLWRLCSKFSSSSAIAAGPE